MTRYPVRYLILGLASCIVLAGLTAWISNSYYAAIAQSSRPDTSTPAMAQPAINPQLVTADNQFGFQLFSQLVQQDPAQNLMISPTSVAIALSMLYNGAQGETQQQIANTLELQGLSLEDLNHANAALKTVLEQADPSVKLAIANSLWGNQQITFKPDFMARMRSFYTAEVKTLDFNDPAAVNTINRWVEHHTEGKIPTILDQINPNEAMFLINAVYFKGQWQQKFDTAQTSDRPFTLLDGSTRNHPLMSQSGNYLYQENDRFQAVSLPYGDGRLSMDVFLPKPGVSLTQFYPELLSTRHWNTAMTHFTRRDGTIQLPRFQYEYTVRLNDALKSLGMPLAFDPDAADLKGLTEQASHVSEVRHKTFIEVNETGTEAAAVTSIAVQTTSLQLPTEPFTMTVDRPFFYTIRDHKTGAILFMGCLVNPQ
ncbi:MAG TPA: serpin family protein [Coleofasciculaceae cyanobacterium]